MKRTLRDANVNEAMKEIRKILKQRNLAGHIIVSSPTHVEHELMYDAPKWAAVTILKNSVGEMRVNVRPRSGMDEHELAKFHITYNVLEAIRKIIYRSRDSLDWALAQLDVNLTVVDFCEYQRKFNLKK